MNKLSANFIKILQKNKFLSRMAEDLYSYIPYLFMGGRALNPLNILLLLTYRCNLRCNMCYYYNEAEESNTHKMLHDRKSEELTYAQIEKMVDDIAEMGVKVLTLHGGEPLVYGDLFKISKYARSKGLLVNFFTNGILLNEENIDKLIDAGINAITISIDGPPAIHDKIRGLNGAFVKVLDGIAVFKRKEKEGKVIPKLAISTAVTALNQDSVMELFEMIKTTGIIEWGIGLVTYNEKKLSVATEKILGLSDQNRQGDISNLPDELINLDPDRMLELRDKLRKANIKANLKITFPSINSIINYSDPAYSEEDYCLFPWARAVISPYGEVYPCIPLSLMDANMGNIKDESMKKIWNGKKFVEFRKSLKKNRLFPICPKCCSVNNNKLLS